MKKILLILPLLLVVGCSNEIEVEKNTYLAYKNNLQEEVTFTDYDDLPCNILISIDRLTKEEISYRAIIDNPKEDMYEVKAIVIHNHFTEDIFPSIGIFDTPYDLLVGDDKVKGISLVGYIETTKNIEDLDLEVRVLLEYKDALGVKKRLYYKTT